jgi:single-stranded DNA-specific DHH superfamily exonuclease
MRVPKQLRDSHTEDAIVRELERDGKNVITVDFGSDAADMSVDVVDDLVIVITDDRQFEFELPAGATDVSVNNGVLTISE